MENGKRINRITISLDDETLNLITHLANYDDRKVAEYIAKIVIERVHGVKSTIPGISGGEHKNRCCE